MSVKNLKNLLNLKNGLIGCFVIFLISFGVTKSLGDSITSALIFGGALFTLYIFLNKEYIESGQYEEDQKNKVLSPLEELIATGIGYAYALVIVIIVVGIIFYIGGGLLGILKFGWQQLN
jgi:hypothetical protein